MGLELSELEKLVAAVESLSDGNTEQAVLEVAEFTNEQVDTSLGVLASLNQILMAVGTMHQMKKIEQFFAPSDPAGKFGGKSPAEAFSDGVQAALAFPERWQRDMSRYEVKGSSEQLTLEPAGWRTLGEEMRDELDGVSLGFGVSSGDAGDAGGEHEAAASGSGYEKGASRARKFVEEQTRSRDGRVWPAGSVPTRPADQRGLEEGPAGA